MSVRYWKFLSEELNFSIIPLNGKVPAVKNWPQWRDKKRPFDETEFDGNNAGVVLDPTLVVIDVDFPDRFEEFLYNNQLEIPETYTVKTGSGKHHYYFRITDGKHYKGTNRNDADGFELRTYGQMIALPGSIHPETGKKYTLEKEVPIATAPAWVMNILKEKLPKPNPPLQLTSEDIDIDIEALSIPAKIKSLINTSHPTGKRSEAMWAVLCSLKEAGYDPSIMKAILNKMPIGEKARKKGESWTLTEIQRVMEKDTISKSKNMFSQHEDKARYTHIITRKFFDSEWLCEGLIPAGEYGFLVAPGSTGKGLFCLKLAYSVATGSSLFPGMEACQQGKVLYISYEDNTRTIRDRLQTLTPSGSLIEQFHENREMEKRRLFREAANGNWYVVGDTKLKKLHEYIVKRPEELDPDIAILNKNLIIFDSEFSCGPLVTRAYGGFKHTNTFNDLLHYAQSISNLKLIIVDTLAQAAGEAETGNAEAAKFNNGIQELIGKTGATVLITAHTTKETSRLPNSNKALAAHSQRGPSAFYSAARFQLTMIPTQPEAIYRSEADNIYTSYVALQVTKCNHADHLRTKITLRKHSEEGRESFQPAIPTHIANSSAKDIQDWIIAKVSEVEPITLRGLKRTYGKKEGNPFRICGKEFEYHVDKCIEAGQIILTSNSRRGFILSSPAKISSDETG